jgi:hypothetical protein
VQELMRKINREEASFQARIENTKAVLKDLPKTNWFKRGEALIGDHKEFGDAGIYDVFLHARDIPFTVAEIYELVEEAGLKVIEFIERGRAKYLVDTYLHDPKVLEKIRRLPKKEQQGLAELIASDFIVHNCYVARSPDTVAEIDDLRNVPFYFLYEPENIADWIAKHPGQRVSVKGALFDATIEFMPGKYTGTIFKHLDGSLSLKEIFEEVRKDAGASEQDLSNDELLHEFRPIYQRFNDIGWMLLRHRSVGRFRSLQDLQRPPA